MTARPWTWWTRRCSGAGGPAGGCATRNISQAVDQLPEQAWEDPDHLPLRAAVQALPEQLRAVILLRYFFDCTLRETAELLRMPRSTVHTREKKALKLLKLELSEEV